MSISGKEKRFLKLKCYTTAKGQILEPKTKSAGLIVMNLVLFVTDTLDK